MKTYNNICQILNETSFASPKAKKLRLKIQELQQELSEEREPVKRRNLMRQLQQTRTDLSLLP